MPELPEVETTRRGIESHIEGQEIIQVIVRESKLRWAVPENIDALISGKRIVQVKRRGKYLLINLGSGHLIVHLGMSGSLRILKTFKAPDKHDHIDVMLGGSHCLRYTDPRRFGAFLWSESPLTEHALLKHLGPEPLDSEEFTACRLYDKSRGKRQSVKAFIMDSKVVVGVGNIYATESLFQAGIRPDRGCGAISLNRYKRLVEAIRKTLAQAIEQGGATLQDFVGVDGQPGYFENALSVYGRRGLPCVKCGNKIKEVRLSNRSSCYCGCCQR